VDHVNDFIRRKRIPDPLAARQMWCYCCTVKSAMFRNLLPPLACLFRNSCDTAIITLSHDRSLREDRSFTLLRAFEEQVFLPG
jgi:hypothetical protein